MLDRRARLIGQRLIESALAKIADSAIFNPTIGSLKAEKSKQLGTSVSASATVPKVLTTPSNT